MKFKFSDKVRKETYASGIFDYIVGVLPDGIKAIPPHKFSIDEPVYLISPFIDGFAPDGIMEVHMARESKLLRYEAAQS
jgi:hypothetical protein